MDVSFALLHDCSRLEECLLGAAIGLRQRSMATDLCLVRGILRCIIDNDIVTEIHTIYIGKSEYFPQNPSGG